MFAEKPVVKSQNCIISDMCFNLFNAWPRKKDAHEDIQQIHQCVGLDIPKSYI
jgi:hypothetical protein